MTQAGENYAASLRSASEAPAWSQVMRVAESNAAGDRLHGSPELDRAVAQNTASAMQSAADSSARIKSGLAKNGVGFSTAAQQADQSNRARAAAEAAASNSQAYAQNYLAERANQNSAGAQVAQAQQAPLSYLSGVSNALISPLNSAGNLVTGMSSGGQMINTRTSGQYSPSMGSNIMNGFSGVIGSL